MKKVITHYRVPEGKTKRKGRPSPFRLHYYQRGEGFTESSQLDGTTPAARGGLTTCEFVSDDGKLLAQGAGICSFSDNFNYRTGRLIAEGRALKKLGSEISETLTTIIEDQDQWSNHLNQPQEVK